MKASISTTIEQSRRLLSCGVDPETADMCWTQRTHRIDGTPIKESHQKANLWLGYPCKRYMEDDEQRIDTPAWSLSALSEIAKSLIPKDVIVGIDCKDNEWIACVEWFQYEAHIRKHFKAEHLIDIFLNMIEWLCANGYSLNKIEK